MWESLCELRSIADSLWEEANAQNLRSFSMQLSKTSNKVEKSYLFIEETHYKNLSNLLNEFKNYKIGKRKLILLYKSQNIGFEDIERLIHENGKRKEKYEFLMKKIGDNLKRQVKGRPT